MYKDILRAMAGIEVFPTNAAAARHAPALVQADPQ